MMRLRRDRRAVVAVETALVITFLLLPLTAGMIGTGTAMVMQYRLDRGLHAALMYAWYNGATIASSGTTSGIATAASSGYGGSGSTPTVSASLACYCITPTGTRSSGTAIACNATCSTAGTTKATWATASLDATFIEVFNTPWSSGTWHMSTTGTVRIQ